MSNLRLFLFLLVLGYQQAAAQFTVTFEQAIEQLNFQGGLPEKLLSTRTAEFYDYDLTSKELDEVQLSFQRTGVDAIIHFELDKLFASKDVTKAFADYLLKREITNLVFVTKDDQGYRIVITTFSGKENVIEPNRRSAKIWSV